VTARAHVSAVVIHADGTQTTPPRPAVEYAQLADKHPDVKDALAILGKPGRPNWVDLYKVFEIVRDNVDSTRLGKGDKEKKLVDTGWVTRPDLKTFGTSANHQLASGDDARHARMPGAPKRVMSLEEGTQFIRDLVGRWLSELT
jgi:hypothetical protein